MFLVVAACIIRRWCGGVVPGMKSDWRKACREEKPEPLSGLSSNARGLLVAMVTARGGHITMAQWSWLPLTNRNTNRHMGKLDLAASAERNIVDLSRSGVPNACVIGRYSYHSPHAPLPPHRHDGMLEICYLQRGFQTYWVGREKHEMAGGEIFVTFPGETHSTGTAPEDRGSLYWLILRIRAGDDRFLGEGGPAAKALISALLRMPRRAFKAPDRAAEMLEEILKYAANSSDPLARLKLKSALLQFLLSVVAQARANAGSALSERMRRVLDHVQSRPAEAPTLSELAAFARLSLSRFKTRFRKEVGVPPSEYIARARIAAAQSLLSDGNSSITEVAHAMGFASSQHFATVFRRYTGQSARSWLRRIRLESPRGARGENDEHTRHR